MSRFLRITTSGNTLGSSFESWYLPFHTRRTHTAHSFGPYVSPRETSEDLLLFHTQDSRFPELEQTPAVEKLFSELCDGFDESVDAICSGLCRWFHPFDIVALNLLEGPFNERLVTSVWVREIMFDQPRGPRGDGYVLLSQDGVIQGQSIKE